MVFMKNLLELFVSYVDMVKIVEFHMGIKPKIDKIWLSLVCGCSICHTSEQGIHLNMGQSKSNHSFGESYLVTFEGYM